MLKLLIRSLLLGLLLAGSLTRAQAQIFLCVDENGRKELTDVSKKGNCKALELPGAMTMPPKRPGGAAKAPTAAPVDFPKVDNAQQKARDADRRQILDDELKAEAAKLADLKKAYNNGEPERQGNERNFAKYQERVTEMKDGITRVEKNIEALNREISAIR